MRLIRGVSLRDSIESFHESHENPRDAKASLELRKLLGHLIDVCNTIEYAHSRGIIHRDIKPDNIMLGKYGETLVVDWGLAKFEGSEEKAIDGESLIEVGSGSGSRPTRLGRSVGTPQYMSPEQAIGAIHRISAASDVYCLGATLYHILTGRPPHDAKSEDLCQLIEAGQFQQPSEIKAIPSALEAICLKAMATRRHARYSSAAALKLDLERWQADETVTAHQESWPHRVGRWTRKHRSAFAMATVTLVVLCVGGMIGGFYWLRNQKLNLEMRRREETRIATVTAQVESLTANALNALENANYISAEDMLQQAADALTPEHEMQEQQLKLQQKLQITRSIRVYYDLSQQGRESIGLEMDMRAFASLRNGLNGLGVFDHGDWWAHLPTEYLTEEEKDRLQERVYSDLLLLGLVHTKRLLMATVQDQLRSPAAAISAWATGKTPFQGDRIVQDATETLDLVELAANYRSAVSTEWLRTFLISIRDGSDYRFSSETLQFRNSADALVVGLFGAVAERSPLLQKVTRNPTAGDRAMVEEAFRIACALSPDNFLAHATCATYLFASGHHRISQSYASQAIAIRPNSHGGYLLRAKALYFEARLLGKATSQREKVRKEHLLKLALQDTNRALQLAPHEPLCHSIHGDVALELADVTEAASEWAQHIELLRDNHLVSTFRFLDSFKKNIRREMRDARKYLDPTKPDHGILSLYAIGYLQQRQFEKSIAHADELLSLDPQSSFALAVRGAAKYASGEYVAAREDLEASLILDPGRFMTHQTLAELESTQQNHEVALTRWKQSKALAKNELQKTAAYFGIGRTLVELNRVSEAIELVQSRFGEFPDAGWERIAGSNETFLQSVVDTRKKWEALPSINRTVRRLPLLNGGFELGFDRHWSNLAGRPTWWNRAGSRSVANVTTDEKHVGNQSLMIEHRSKYREGAYSTTEQMVPIPVGVTDVRVSCWAKGRDVQEGAVFFSLGDNLHNRALEVRSGTNDWQQLEATIPVSEFAGRDVKFCIVSQDVATVWLDDLRLEVVDDASSTPPDGQ